MYEYMKSLKIILATFLISFYSCITTCDDVKRYYTSISYNFLVISKSDEHRDFTFEGYDKKGVFNQLQISRFWSFYDYVEKGDSIVKISGNTELILIKKDTTLVFPLMCRGQVVE